MVTEKIMTEICKSRGMIKMFISTRPTWVTKDKKEGIELETGILKPFWNIAGERNYEEPTSEPVLKTIELIKLADSETKDVKPKGKEKEEQKETENAIVKPDITDAILPDIITPALMSKWAKMTTTDRVLMFQKTPKDKIKSVCVGKENGKDVFAPYVEGNFMFKEANAAFLFDWFLSDVKITSTIEGVGVVATLNCWFSEYNKYFTRPATGHQETNKKVTPELAKKGAITDAIKKGLSLFGFNSDVYSGEREV